MSNEIIQLEKKESSKPNFTLRYISISKYEGDWQSLPHTHHFTELFYVISGKGVFLIEDEPIPVKPNDLIIINPHIEHTEKTMIGDPMEYIVFGVDGLAFSFETDEEIQKNYSYYSYTSSQNHLVNFAGLMLKEFREKKQGFDQVCQSILQVLLIFISREQHLSIISDSTFKISKECALAKRYIDTNYAKNITLDTLADVTHINKYYLAHSFANCIGQSPISYLTDKRLKASMELLINTNHSIAQIASSTGFSSQSYFSQIFKKTIGMTPQQYRKLNTPNRKKVE
ncbi:helix-turn-helix transcriptional regulator [Kineothrix sp. MB12-C1]|uniref:helix-turn-helix transcriptional regulator n=1 Tax=Kineothrix sp. MB12-C1 TaxID=3070215 RepID=UPI0027D2418C|nr:AraC family transcriptional regulator [Kineothrix sp. MB12-C1]WMC94057.1 AraC family transcriptional regulator [Kineothrix sp. MB12-C1]